MEGPTPTKSRRSASEVTKKVCESVCATTECVWSFLCVLQDEADRLARVESLAANPVNGAWLGGVVLGPMDVDCGSCTESASLGDEIMTAVNR